MNNWRNKDKQTTPGKPSSLHHESHPPGGSWYNAPRNTSRDRPGEYIGLTHFIIHYKIHGAMSALSSYYISPSGRRRQSSSHRPRPFLFDPWELRQLFHRFDDLDHSFGLFWWPKRPPKSALLKSRPAASTHFLIAGSAAAWDNFSTSFLMFWVTAFDF